MKMTVGQTCGVYIEAPWAYGKKELIEIQPEFVIELLFFEISSVLKWPKIGHNRYNPSKFVSCFLNH